MQFLSIKKSVASILLYWVILLIPIKAEHLELAIYSKSVKDKFTLDSKISKEIAETDKPVFTSPTTVNFAENSSANAYLTATTDASTVLYSLGTALDESLFNIVQASGVITFKTPPNFEEPTDSDGNNTYQINIIATDEFLNIENQTVTITVTNVNEAPNFTSTAVTSIVENDLYNYSISAEDIDGDELSFTATIIPAWLNLIQAFQVSNIAGTGSPGGANGNGTNAVFRSPQGIVQDASGNMFVADRDNHGIRKIAPNGDVTSVAGRGVIGSADGNGFNASFSFPTGLAIDNTGNLFVADFNNHTIRKINSAGDVTTFAGLAGSTGTTNANGSIARFNGPLSIAVDAANNIIVADFNNHSIRKIDENGNVTTIAGTGIRGSLNNNGASASFDGPSGVAIDADGNIFIADRNNHLIRKIALNGDVTTFAGIVGLSGAVDGDNTVAKFNSPTGITVGNDGNLYVADYGNNLIRKISDSGIVSTVAGSGSIGSNSGNGTTASFNAPISILYSHNGDLIVADQNNHLIRRILTQSLLSGNPSGQIGTHQVEITANDGNGGATVQSFDILVTDAIAPVFNSSLTVEVAENNSSVFYTATAIDENTITFSIKTELDGALFDIDENTGEINFKVAADYENPNSGGGNNNYSINIEATDGNNIAEMNLAITVNNVNEATSFTSTPITAIDDDTKYDYTVTTDDIDGDAVTITPTTIPDWLTYTPASDVVLVAGTGVKGNTNSTNILSSFNFPSGIALDAQGNIIIADRSNHLIRKIDTNGTVTTIAGSGIPGSDDGIGTQASFKFPTFLAIDNSNNIYVADTENQLIRKIDANGEVTTVAGTGTIGNMDGNGVNASFSYPSGIAIDASGNLFVADQGNHRIRKIETNGTVTTFAGGDLGHNDGSGVNANFNAPVNITLDNSGDFIIVDRNNNLIRKMLPNGVVTTIAGNRTSGNANGNGTNASFNNPIGITVDGSGNIFIADATNNVIRKIDLSNEVTTFAGSGTLGNVAGNVTNARFNSPFSLLTDAAGDLIVSDLANHSIRKITSQNKLAGDSNGKSGEYDITLTASDGNGSEVTQDFTIIVTDVTVPVFTSPAAVQFASKGTDVAYTAIATDGNTIAYSFGSGNDESLFNIDSQTGEVTFKAIPDENDPKDNGVDNIYDVNIIANDGTFTANINVAITVLFINQKPVFTSTPTLEIDDKSTYEYIITTSDFEETTVTITGIDLPNWLTLNQGTDLKLSGSTIGIAGSHAVSLKAEDEDGGITFQNFTIDVLPTIQFTLEASENLESVGSANIQVELSSASTNTITIEYTVSGTAIGEGEDYILADGTLTFDPSDVSKEITISDIIDNNVNEAHKTIVITLSNAISATLGQTSVHTYTILDDEITASLPGNEQNICGTSATLAANEAIISLNEAGKWTIKSGTAGTFTNENSNSSTFNGSEGESYTLTWTISDGAATPNSADVNINLFGAPTTAIAGQKQIICGETTTLEGNVLLNDETGIWKITSGAGGNISNDDSPTSSFTGVRGTTYTLTWESRNGVCENSIDQVEIEFLLDPISAAGDNQNICGNTTALDATATNGTGKWSIVSGSGGNINDVNDPQSSFEGIINSSYTLRWTVTNGSCTAATNDVIISFFGNPTTPLAGDNQVVCNTNTVLDANAVAQGETGHWEIISGTGGSINNNNNPQASLTGVRGETYSLKWTIGNDICQDLSDQVNIEFLINPSSSAGDDQSICGTTTTLNATATNGIGQWSIIDGTGGSIDNDQMANSSFSGIQGNTYTLRWTVTNGNCAPALDDVIISLLNAPTLANAGDDIQVCGNSTTLSANQPANNETGTWEIVSGIGGEMSNSNSPTATFSGVLGSSYTLSWTLSNGVCQPSSNQVNLSLLRNPVSTIGSNQSICGTSTTISATATNGSGVWSIISGDGGSVNIPNNANATFAGVSGTAYTLRWTVTNAACTSASSDVSIVFSKLTSTSNAGEDQVVCDDNTLLQANNVASGETGTWSITSGTGGVIASPNDPNSTFTGFQGNSYTLTWTISNGQCQNSTDQVKIDFFNRPTSQAGDDKSVCGTSTQLAGLATNGTGSWSIIAGQGGTISNPNLANTTFSGAAQSTHTLRFTVSNDNCSSAEDDINITFINATTVADAGQDLLVCGEETILEANSTAEGESGSWTIKSGEGGQISSNSNPNATFTGIRGVEYILTWTISNNICQNSSDDVKLNLLLDPLGSAGDDQVICGNSTTLNASAQNGIGTWSIVSGTGGSFGNTTNPITNFNGIAGINYLLNWTISNGKCEDIIDEVNIQFNSTQATQNAGQDQIVCANFTTLNANTLGEGETGAWSITSGTGGEIIDINDPKATFTGTRGTTYSLLWSINNGICNNSSDQVDIQFQIAPNSNAGPDQNICGTTTSLAAVSTNGPGSWSVVSGNNGSFSSTTNPNSSFTGREGTSYTLRWTVTNGTCTPVSDDVVINFNTPPTAANAGLDQTIRGDVTTVTANIPSGLQESGTWSIVSGDGNGYFDNTESKKTSTKTTVNFNGTRGQVYTLRWTVSNPFCGDTTDDLKITIETNSNPTFTSTAQKTVNDNESFSYTIRTNDLDKDVVTITVVSKPDWLVFDSRNNIISGAAKDQKGTHAVSILAKDVYGGETIQSFAIDVIDATSPVFTSPISVTIAENTVGDFYQAKATDTNPITFGFVSVNDESKFIINNNSGQIRFIDAPDFENPTDIDKNNTYLVNVIVKDQSGNSSNQIVTISVSDEEETTITDIVLSKNNIEENNTRNQVIGSFTSTDSKSNLVYVYSLVNGLADNNSFSISNNNLIANDIFDFEKKSSYTIRVKSNNLIGSKFEKDFEVKIINKSDLEQTITFEPLDEVFVGSSLIEISATSTSGLPVSFTSSNRSVAIVDGNQITVVGSGNAVIIATQAGDENFIAAIPVQRTLTVNKKEQVITFEPIAQQSLSVPSVQLKATSTSNLKVVFSIESGPATISEDFLLFDGDGRVTVVASQPGNNEFLPATRVSQTFEIKAVTAIERDLVSIKIFPNPTSNILFIEMQNHDKVNMSLFTINGVEVLSYSAFTGQIDLSGFAEGVYFLKISTKDGVFEHKIIKH